MRPSWTEYFMDMAFLVAKRSTCIRRNVGCVIVRNNRPVCTGYNGAPSGIKHCAEVGCFREQNNIASGSNAEKCRGAHAEQNAIAQAARFGIAVEGASIFSTTIPCNICAKILINAGIKQIYFSESYDDDMAIKMLEGAGVVITRIEPSAN